MLHCVNNVFGETSHAQGRNTFNYWDFFEVYLSNEMFSYLFTFIGLLFLFPYSIHIFLSYVKYFGPEIQLTHIRWNRCTCKAGPGLKFHFM